MSNIVAINAEIRTQIGKSAARAVRCQNRIPAIIYGNALSPEPISLDAKELNKLLGSGSFNTSICAIKVNGKTVKTIPRDIHFDPVRDFVTHIDFMRLNENTRINLNIPLRFLNEQASLGLKRGGILNIVCHEVELSCPADKIPDHLDVDLTGIEIGHSIHMSSIEIPEDVHSTAEDLNFTVATIVAPVEIDETSGNDDQSNTED